MSCLYYFKWSDKKNRTFDVDCIVKWGSKIDKIAFWGVHNYCQCSNFKSKNKKS